MSKHARTILTFRDLRAKADWLDAEASRDALTIPVRRLAMKIAGATRNVEELARALHRWVRDRIAYEHDHPRVPALAMGEELDDSADILERGYDDCDGKARLLVALVRALPGRGLQARTRPVFPEPDRFSHVQAELRWPGSEAWEAADDDGWVLAETILQGCELGDDPERAPRDAQGRRVLAGPPSRYRGKTPL